MICDLAASNTKRHLTQVPLVDQYKSQLSLGGARLVISRRTVNTKPICGWLHHLQKFMNPQALAEAVAEGLKEAGCEVDTPNTNDGRYDVTQFPHAARRLCGLWLAGLLLLRSGQPQAVHGRPLHRRRAQGDAGTQGQAVRALLLARRRGSRARWDGSV